MHVFRNSIDNWLFPEKMKIAKVTPIFEVSKKELVTNYRPIFVFPYLSKILERNTSNRFFSYFDQNKILNIKYFAFTTHHSTDQETVS